MNKKTKTTQTPMHTPQEGLLPVLATTEEVISPIHTAPVDMKPAADKGQKLQTQVYDTRQRKVLKIGSHTADYLVKHFPEQFQTV